MAVCAGLLRLLAHSQPPHRLPQGRVREPAAYPDWRGAFRPGARVAPTLQRSLDAP